MCAYIYTNYISIFTYILEAFDGFFQDLNNYVLYNEESLVRASVIGCRVFRETRRFSSSFRIKNQTIHCTKKKSIVKFRHLNAQYTRCILNRIEKSWIIFFYNPQGSNHYCSNYSFIEHCKKDSEFFDSVFFTKNKYIINECYLRYPV